MKPFILLISLMFLFTCNRPKPRINEITKIEIATGGCFGPCQLTDIVIDSALQYHYYGAKLQLASFPKPEQRHKLIGFYSTKITREFWDSLNIKLEQINYKHLDTSYEHSADDESMEVFIHYSGKVKHIEAQSLSLPDSIANVFYYIIKSYKMVKLKATRDKFSMESKIIQPPPKPDMRSIKFPPTKKLKN